LLIPVVYHGGGSPDEEEGMTNKPAAFRRTWIPAVILLFGASSALALEPPTREQIERYRRDGTLAARIADAKAFNNHVFDPALIERFQRKLNRLTPHRISQVGRLSSRPVARLAAPPRPSGLPTTGTVKILALLVAFSDYPGVTAPEDVTAKLFGDGSGGYPYESLRNYYRRASYDQLEFEGEVLGWYTTAYARSEVDETTTGRQNLIKEALDHYDQQGFDFSPYDNDGDGDIDYFCVFWAGPHGEWAEFWWGYYTGFSDPTYYLDGKRLSRYSWQWELSNYPSGSFTPRVVMHETGHALGLPDYYDYDGDVGPDGGLGNLDMMDANVGDHNCFSKFMLDWISPTVASTNAQGVVLRASGQYPDALIFMPAAVPGQIFYEYYMVQNRYRTMNDASLFTGANGLLVWHVDARLNTYGTNFLYDNSYTEHKLLRLMEADGLEEIETYDASADADDYYREGMSFTGLTFPNTDRYDGTPTNMGIGNIVGTTTPIILDVFDLDSPPVCEIQALSPGETLYGTVVINVSTDDDYGIDRVELYADGELKGTTTTLPASFSLDTTTVANGTRTIRAVAYDTSLQSGSDEVSVLVDNIYAPREFAAQRVVNRSLFRREYINYLRWADDPQNSSSVVKFRVYLIDGLDRVLLAEINRGQPGSAHQYWHRGVGATGTYSYEVVALNLSDREGEVAAATVH
jgi:M6 family metalloprotease-like protein